MGCDLHRRRNNNENGQKACSAKELYLGLEMNYKNWSKWYPTNIINNDFFLENEDWIEVVTMTTTEKGGQVGQDFAISTEFAKHLAMQARTKKSHEYRNYFIACEKQLKEINSKAQLLLDIYNGGSQAVVASKQLTEIEVKEATKLLSDKLEEQQPLVEFTNTVLKSKDNILMRELSKIAKDEGIEIGQNRLYDKLRDWNLIMKKPSTEPYQYGMDRNWFVVEEKSINTPYDTKLTKTTKVTPKGQVYIIEKLKKDN